MTTDKVLLILHDGERGTYRLGNHYLKTNSTKVLKLLSAIHLDGDPFLPRADSKNTVCPKAELQYLAVQHSNFPFRN